MLLFRLAAMWSTFPPSTTAPPVSIHHLSPATARYDTMPYILKASTAVPQSENSQQGNINSDRNRHRPNKNLLRVESINRDTHSRNKRSLDRKDNQTASESVKMTVSEHVTDNDKDNGGDEDEFVFDYNAIKEEDPSINMTEYESFYDASALNTSFGTSDNSSRNSTELFVSTTIIYEYQMIKVAVLCTVMSIIILSTCKMSLQVFAKYAVRDKPYEM